MQDYKAACFFLDVGQGTSQVIHLGNRRAIIVDTGPKRQLSPLLFWLQDRKIQTIEALILSHNDADHIGEAARIIESYGQQIRYLYFLVDRKNNLFNRVVMNAVKDGYIERSKIRRLETDNEPKQLFKEAEIEIDLLFPAFADNLESGTPNETSAIIAFTIGTNRIIFSGDASISAWEAIVDRHGRIEAQIFTAPHHGGSFTRSKPNTDAFQEEIVWFHREAVLSGCMVVSVGTNNRYQHPEPKIISSHAKHGVEVLCTQGTPKCYGVGVAKDTACCGTIEVNIGPNSFCIKDIDLLRSQKSRIIRRLCLNQQQ